MFGPITYLEMAVFQQQTGGPCNIPRTYRQYLQLIGLNKRNVGELYF